MSPVKSVVGGENRVPGFGNDEQNCSEADTRPERAVGDSWDTACATAACAKAFLDAPGDAGLPLRDCASCETDLAAEERAPGERDSEGVGDAERGLVAATTAAVRPGIAAVIAAVTADASVAARVGIEAARASFAKCARGVIATSASRTSRKRFAFDEVRVPRYADVTMAEGWQ